MAGSSSSSSSKIEVEATEQLLNVDLRCKHGLKAKLGVTKRGQNVGKLFFGCPLWKSSPCGYFMWVKDLGIDHIPGLSMVVEDKVVGEVGTKQANWEAKAGRLKQKKEILMAENESLKKEVMMLKIDRDVSRSREWVLCKILCVSWVVFILVLTFVIWISL